MKGSPTFLSLTDSASPITIGFGIVAVGGGIALWHGKIGLIVAALGILQVLLVSRERWSFDKAAGTVTIVRETGWTKAIMGRWPLDEFSGVVSRHVVTTYAESESHHFDLALIRRSGEERPVISVGSVAKARSLAAFLGLPIQEIGPIDSFAMIAPIVSSAAGALWREKGLRGVIDARQAVPFLERYLRDHPDDPSAVELHGAFLALSGDRTGGVSTLLQAADRFRSRGDTEGAERAEQAARRLTDLPMP